VRKVLLAVLGVVLLAGCGVRLTPTPLENETTLPIATTTPVTVSPGPCPEGVEFSTLGADAAMGLRVLTIEMVNCGAEPYTVNGYPSLRLYDEDGDQIEVAVLQGSGGIASLPDFDVPPAEVVLQPGERAWAGLVWRNLVTEVDVDASTAVRMEAAAAAGQPWLAVPMDVTIDLGNTGRLGVQPWHRA
jgi:hypothetical protein